MQTKPYQHNIFAKVQLVRFFTSKLQSHCTIGRLTIWISRTMDPTMKLNKESHIPKSSAKLLLNKTHNLGIPKMIFCCSHFCLNSIQKKLFLFSFQRDNCGRFLCRWHPYYSIFDGRVFCRTLYNKLICG